MTTPAAEALYRAQHDLEMEGKRYAVYNPHNKQLEELPIIYGFNNGGTSGFLSAQLIAEDGAGMGSHLCSHECYMRADLGVLEGTRSDRHEGFQKHYPDGYRMAFVQSEHVEDHPGLDAAYQRNQELAAASEKQTTA